jgi:predicted AlkP superfamily pyrophosphatase or phosphodiesterase
MRFSRLLRLLIPVLLLAASAGAAPVLLVSIDGLKPEYVTRADEHGLKIPNLRAFLTEGSYAEGVVGVVPTVTYPSHTTILTGVWPAEHGILANTTFDPLRKNHGGWFWYAQEIRVPTLWDAASQGGIITASVNWPVSVAARGVRYLIPEYWRAGTPDDLLLIEALSRPDGWMETLEKKLGPYVNGGEGTVAGDEVRTKYAVEVLRTIRPGFMTLHLVSLDEAEHQTAPFSKESCETLEALDGMIGRLAAAASAMGPGAVVAVVSDHGFVRTDHRVNLAVAFVREGFITLGKPGSSPGATEVAAWSASPWQASAVAGVMLKDPADPAFRRRVGEMLNKLGADPENGIARVVSAAELEKLGGFPGAAFLVELKPGYQFDGAYSGPLVTPAPSTGTHGYLPDRPEMRASFFIRGSGIAHGRQLGVIDMRRIAPTVAAVLGVPFPSARQPKLDVTTSR